MKVSEAKPGWERGAWEPRNLDELRSANGLWISGGDQNAIMRLLFGPDGTSFGALSLPKADGPGASEIERALWTCPGLGFYPYATVDQHFDARARLGRLVRAELDDPRGRRLGVGVAEDSALDADVSSGGFEVIGAAGAYVVDAAEATETATPSGRTAIRGVRPHYILPGDRWDAATR